MAEHICCKGFTKFWISIVSKENCTRDGTALGLYAVEAIAAKTINSPSFTVSLNIFSVIDFERCSPGQAKMEQRQEQLLKAMEEVKTPSLKNSFISFCCSLTDISK